jgi:hypothetical protein
MKSKPIQKFYVIYKDGSKYVLWLEKSSVKKTRATIEMDALANGQEVAAIKVIAADGSLSFLK